MIGAYDRPNYGEEEDTRQEATPERLQFEREHRAQVEWDAELERREARSLNGLTVPLHRQAATHSFRRNKMHRHLITPRPVSTLPPALIVQALDRLDDAGKTAIARRVCELILCPNAYTKSLSAALLEAIQAEIEAQADEARWLEREEQRQNFELGIY